MIDDLVALPFKVTFQVSMKQQHFDLRPSATFNNDVDFFSSNESKGKKINDYFKWMIGSWLMIDAHCAPLIS